MAAHGRCGNVSGIGPAGHSLRAMARSATAVRMHDPKLEKLDGDALDCMFAEIRERPVSRHARYED